MSRVGKIRNLTESRDSQASLPMAVNLMQTENIDRADLMINCHCR
jgi:hypothetical protein